MKKNLLDKTCAERIVDRVQRLQADTAPLWGTMTATEMLLHCNKVHEQLLKPSTPSLQRTTVKQYLARWAVLYVLPHFPKYARAPRQVQTKGLVNETEFAQQKQAFIDGVRRFATYGSPIEHRHPYFGNLRTKQWGLTSWKHVDHHLRQFGI